MILIAVGTGNNPPFERVFFLTGKVLCLRWISFEVIIVTKAFCTSHFTSRWQGKIRRQLTAIPRHFFCEGEPPALCIQLTRQGDVQHR